MASTAAATARWRPPSWPGGTARSPWHPIPTTASTCRTCRPSSTCRTSSSCPTARTGRQRRHQSRRACLRRRLHRHVRRLEHEQRGRRLLQSGDRRLLLRRLGPGRPRRRHRRLGRRLSVDELRGRQAAGDQRRLHRAQQLGFRLGRRRLLLRLLRRPDIGTTMAAFTGESASDYAQNLGYDKLGFTDTFGYRPAPGYDGTTAWMAAGFTVKGGSDLEAASFYAQEPGYDLRRSTSAHEPGTTRPTGPRPARARSTRPATAPSPSTHSWPAKAGVKFYVIVRPDDTDHTPRPIPLEDALPGYSSEATTAAGPKLHQLRRLARLLDRHRRRVRLAPRRRLRRCSPVRGRFDLIKPVTRALAAVKVDPRPVRDPALPRERRSRPHDTEKVTIKITNRTGRGGQDSSPPALPCARARRSRSGTSAGWPAASTTSASTRPTAGATPKPRSDGRRPTVR